MARARMPVMDMALCCGGARVNFWRRLVAFHKSAFLEFFASKVIRTRGAENCRVVYD